MLIHPGFLAGVSNTMKTDGSRRSRIWLRIVVSGASVLLFVVVKTAICLKSGRRKSIHRPASSLLATNSGFNNFRGLFNLGLFLLLITTARMALENVMKYGIIMDPSSWIRFILHTPDKYFAFGLLICSNLFVITALLLERATVRGLLGNRLSLALTIWNLICVLAFPTGVILSVDFNPLFSAPVLLVYTTLFLKLFSYAATNRWCRQSQMKEISQNLNKIAGLVSAKTVTDSCLLNQNKAKSELEDTSYVKQRNTITNVEGEEKEASNSSESSKQTNPEKEGEQFTQGNLLLHRTVSSPTMKSRSKSIPQFSEKFDITQLRCGRLSLCGSFGYKSLTETLEHEPYDPQLSLEKRPLKPLQYISYPDNLTLRNIYYFIFAPTLCYEINFPRTLTIRKTFLVKRLFEIIFIPQLCFCLVQQWILPILKNSVIPIQQAGFSQLVERCLKLAVPNHLIWILMFYALFHSFFNFLGELLHFGDRFFYGDWWNAETVPAFWSTWNIPVHRFARRHIYVPLISAGLTRSQAAMVVFFISAVLHEFLVSVPMKMPRMWAFLAMFSQVPYAYLVNHLFPNGGTWGNIAVWITLIIGQPLVMLFYFHDFYIAHYVKSEV